MKPSRQRAALVVGSVAIDRVETPFAKSENILGGAATFASIASSFFAPTRLIAAVGGDFPPAHLRRLKKHGIDLRGLQIDPAEKTFFWAGRYHEHFAGRDTTEIQLNVFERFSPVLPEAYRDSAVVMLGAITPSLQHHVIDQFEACGRRPYFVADTFDLWIHTTKPDLLRLLKRVDLFVINEDESLLLTGARDLTVAAKQLRSLGPRTIVIKKGGHGSMLFHADGRFAVPAYPVTKFVDPTGAGDSYAGAIAGCLAAAGRTDFAALRTAVAYATAVSSLTVESFSVNRLSAAGRRTIDARFKALREMTRF
ncbi:MAG TPA: PfkB family carbohydrate kinase [Opitutaceae bacterium]|jgi:sugar/nucleoside kinase (ribokinase family)